MIGRLRWRPSILSSSSSSAVLWSPSVTHRVWRKNAVPLPLQLLSPPLHTRSMTLGSDVTPETHLNRAVSQAIRDDPSYVPRLLASLSEEEQKAFQMAVYPIFEKNLQKEFFNADANKDRMLDEQEFSRWYRKQISSYVYPLPHPKEPSRKQLLRYIVRNCIPFIGFGFTDNAVMLLAGEYIDLTLGSALHLTTMAAAAIGNLISVVAGIGFGTAIEAIATRMNLPDPMFTAHQLHSRTVAVAKVFANTSGLIIGCLLGMFPLVYFGFFESPEPPDSSSSSSKGTDAASPVPPIMAPSSS